MHARKALSVLPEPVGAEINVVRLARMEGHPASWGSVGVSNLRTNHSCTTGCAQASEAGICTSWTAMECILSRLLIFANSSLFLCVRGGTRTGRCYNPRHGTSDWDETWAVRDHWQDRGWRYGRGLSRPRLTLG